MTLDNVLANENVNSEVYLSDVSLWLKDRVPMRECREIARKLTELKRRIQNGRSIG